MTIKVHLIAAARPNFMKIAPLYHDLKKKAGWSLPLCILASTMTSICQTLSLGI